MPRTASSTAEDHEVGMIKWFSKNKRERYASLLVSKKGRSKFLGTLYHSMEWAEDVLHKVPPGKQNPHGILEELRNCHAGQQCYCISTNSELDGQFVDAQAALEVLVGSGAGTILSFIPGKLGYYESEEPGVRYIISA